MKEIQIKVDIQFKGRIVRKSQMKNINKKRPKIQRRNFSHKRQKRFLKFKLKKSRSILLIKNAEN